MATAQLIDADGTFTGQLPLPPSVAAVTRSYKIVAVVGCQSGGKSTLLNHTFGTAFPVLDAPRRGRRRTTLGVWGAVSSTSSSSPSNVSTSSTSHSPFVVLDVEGTDSRERGEGAKSFESRTTLFTLALADCVLVNMWAHDIGRYSAANYDLFETVFAHAIALRSSSTSSSIMQRPVSVLIVIRDHDGESAIADIRRVLMGDLSNIWESLRVKDAALSDVFSIDVVTLPHKVYAPGAFADAVGSLSKRVAMEVNNRRDQKLVPLEAFDTLARTVWDAVCRCTGGNRTNSEGVEIEGSTPFTLDLPKHATLTAYFRCGEIMTSLWDSDIGSRLDDLRSDVESNWQKPVENYASRVSSIVKDAFQNYDSSTAPYQDARYAREAAQQRRDELATQLASRVLEIRERYIGVCWDHCMTGFDDEFQPLLGGTRGFERRARRIAKSFISKYRSFMTEACLPDVLRDRVELSPDGTQRDNLLAGDQTAETDPFDGNAVEFVDEIDIVDLRLGLNDDDDDDDMSGSDEYSVDRFKREVMQKVEERKRLGELMLPVSSGRYGPGGVKQPPWWKGLLIRGVILLINYLQATQGHRAALKLHRKHEKEFPPAPTF